MAHLLHSILDLESVSFSDHQVDLHTEPEGVFCIKQHLTPPSVMDSIIGALVPTSIRYFLLYTSAELDPTLGDECMCSFITVCGVSKC